MEIPEGERWFIGYSRRLWVPVSWQGWAATVGYFLSIAAIIGLNGYSAEQSLTFRQVVMLVAEFAFPTLAFYRLTHNHVDRRY